MTSTAPAPTSLKTNTFGGGGSSWISPEPEGFKGPPEAIQVAKWLRDWDWFFSANPTADNGKGDEGKIIRAGDKTYHGTESSEDWFKNFRSWYSRRGRALKKWDAFKKGFKDTVLGPNWYIDMLQDFCTFRQGSLSLTDYMERMGDLAEMLKYLNDEPDLDKWMTKSFKQYLVFRANPSLWQHLVENKHFCRDLMDEDVEREAIQDWLERAEKNVGSGGDHDDDHSGTGRPVSGATWTTSGLVGHTSSNTTKFSSHFQFFPEGPHELGRLTSVRIGYDDDNGQLGLKNLSNVFSKGSSAVVAEDTGKHARTLEIGDNDYLVSVSISWNSSGISYLGLTTDRGQSVSVGRENGDRKTFTAPTGRCILGLQMISAGERYGPGALRYSASRLGVIYAPRA